MNCHNCHPVRSSHQHQHNSPLEWRGDPINGEMTQVLATLQAGLNSPDHQHFVQTLADRLS